MASAQPDVYAVTEKRPEPSGSTLLPTLKTAARLVPRQLIDEFELAKLELGQKKSKVGGVAAFSGLALVFLVILIIALVVAAIAGLATLMPLWLAALVGSAAMIVLIGICALVAYKQVKSLLPLVPEQAWHGLRYDLGIVREGGSFDPATLDTPALTKEEKHAQKEQAEADAEAAKAEKEAKDAEFGPKATAQELVARTGVRREHLLNLRAELFEQADVKKQTSYLVDTARAKALDTVSSAAGDAVTQGLDTVKSRWKPLSIMAISATAAVIMLRQLFKK